MKKYETYKPTNIEWIGEIPTHWESIRLKYIGEAIIGITYSPDDVMDDETGILVLRSSNIQDGKLAFEDCVYVNKEINEKHRTKPGDILLCARNGSAHLVGKSALITEEYEGLTFGAFMSVFRSPFGEFAYQFFNSQIFKSQTGLFSTSTINQLTTETLNNLFVPFPPVKEQTAIANYLDIKTKFVNNFISQKGKLIELLQVEKIALISDCLIGDEKNDIFIRLKYVAQINPSKHSFRFEPNSDEEVVFLPMEKVSEDGAVNQELRKPINDVITGYTYFEKGDVIVAKITPCFENGKGAHLDNLETPFGFGSTEFHTIRVRDKLLPEFLYLITKTERFMKVGEAFMSGSAGQKRVPTSFIENFRIWLPSIERQSQIVKYIDVKIQKINSTITQIQQEIELIQEYKTILISDVVTGKIKIT